MNITFGTTPNQRKQELRKSYAVFEYGVLSGNPKIAKTDFFSLLTKTSKKIRELSLILVIKSLKGMQK